MRSFFCFSFFFWGGLRRSTEPIPQMPSSRVMIWVCLFLGDPQDWSSLFFFCFPSKPKERLAPSPKDGRETHVCHFNEATKQAHLRKPRPVTVDENYDDGDLTMLRVQTDFLLVSKVSSGLKETIERIFLGIPT